MSAEPCADCVQATLGPWHGFASSCAGCTARAFSRSPELARLRRDRNRAGYDEALARLGLTQEQVMAAGKTDQLRETA